MLSYLSRSHLSLVGVGLAASLRDSATSQEGKASKSTPSELLATTVFFRHGARTPVFTDIPGLSDIHWRVTTEAANKALPAVTVTSAHEGGARPPLSRGVSNQRNFTLPGGAYAGQLTDLGIEQTKELGRMLHLRYGAQVGDDPAVVGLGPEARMTVRTTNVPRCVASAQGVLSGLFEQSTVARAGPFPLTTLPTAEEYATPNTRTCARLAELFKQSKEAWREQPDGDGPAMLAELRDLLEPAAFRAFGLDKSNFVPIRDLVVALDAHGMPAFELLKDPSSSSSSSSHASHKEGKVAVATSSFDNDGGGGVVKKDTDSKRAEFIRRLDLLGGLQIKSLMQGGGGWANEVETLRLGIGRLLNETVSSLEVVAAGSSSSRAATPLPASGTVAAKIHLVSAHDTTLIPLLAALSNYDGNWPDYASFLAFELWAQPPSQMSSPSSSSSSPPRVPQERFAVRVVFNGKVLVVPGCEGVGLSGGGAEEGMCRLSDFRRALRHVLPTDLEAECRPKSRSNLVEGDGDKF